METRIIESTCESTHNSFGEKCDTQMRFVSYGMACCK